MGGGLAYACAPWFRRMDHGAPFRTRQRQARVGRNPKTGTRVEVPAKKIPYFKPSKELKDVVNAGGKPAESTPGPADAPTL